MTIIYFLLAALGLGILVFIHELGHYYVAKKMGMTVETFSIGFGRPILKWRWDQVDWQLGWLPFGGYVKIAGMEFGRKDKNTYIEPYDIPNGFFTKPPIRRIFVALAGPLANFILAFLIFAAIWAMGGREKPFSDFTQIIGWVDPESELYANGVRPGDVLTSYNGKPFRGSKDLLYAAMLEGKKVNLTGYHVNYETGQRRPFSYTVTAYPSPQVIEGLLTTGVTNLSRYMIYDRLNETPNPFPEGSPMEGSGIEYKDRLVWADGEILFSMEQLSALLNQGKTFLTVKRGNEIFQSRQPRVNPSDLILPVHVRNELMDWQYESNLRKRFQDLKLLPYVVNADGYIEAPLDFIDEESALQAFPRHLDDSQQQKPLQAGDRILAVDGISVRKGHEILNKIQSHQVQMIVQRDVPVSTTISWKDQDKAFEQSIEKESLITLASTIGTPNQLREMGPYVLLNPVEPKRVDQFSLTPEMKERIQEEFEKQKVEIEKIRDQNKKLRAMRELQQSQDKLLLGVYLQDRKVNYNPGPLAMFGNVFVETWQTLKALIMGYLHPKWISGPVGIVQVMQQGWKLGMGEALFWMGAISVNLAFLNLLPIPVLDGGYVCLSLWEMITKKRLKAKVMERLIIPFVVLLVALLVFLTFQDITRLFS